MQHTATQTVHQQSAVPDWVEAFIGSIAAAVAAQLRQQHAAMQKAAKPAAGSPFMSVNEAAVFLRCKPQRLYDLISARRLGSYKDGGRVLIKRSELEMYVTAVEQGRAGANRATDQR